MLSISFRNDHDKEMENNLSTLIIEMYILFARAIITSTVHAGTIFIKFYTIDRSMYALRLVEKPMIYQSTKDRKSMLYCFS